MSNDNADTGMKPEAIYIPVPRIDSALPKLQILTAADLVVNEGADYVGAVQDRAGFSARLAEPIDGRVEFFMKAPGTGFYMPPEYAQFVPAARQIIAYYYSKHGDDGYCCAGLFQGTVYPDDKSSLPFVDAHKDFAQLKDEITKRAVLFETRTIIVSDCLTTGIGRDIEFSTEDQEQITSAKNPDKTIAEILDRSKVTFESVEPYAIYAFGSKTPHALGNPKDSVYRTAFLMIFSGPAFKPAKLLNPWLEKAVADLGSRPTPPMARPAAAPLLAPYIKG